MMTIVRIDAEARWSDVVIHNNTLYYTGVPENLDADAFEQTANTLAQIDAVLEKHNVASAHKVSEGWALQIDRPARALKAKKHR